MFDRTSPPSLGRAARRSLASPAVAAGVVASVLSGLVLFAGPFGLSHVLVFGLGIVVAAAAAQVVRTDGRRYQTAAILAVSLQLAIFLGSLAGSPELGPLRSIQIAVVVSYLAILAAAVLIRLAGLAVVPSFVIGCTIALGILGADAILVRGMSPISLTETRHWPDHFVSHPSLGRSPPPSSEFNLLYSDDRQGYLREEDSRAATWSFSVMPGSVASLVFPPDGQERLRVAIEQSNRDTTWHIQLAQAPFEIVRQRPYFVTFRGRADHPRSVAIGLGQNHPPWSGLGLYREVQLGPEWKRFREIVLDQQGDANSRIFFHLAGSEISVEVDSVELHGPPDGGRIQPVSAGGRFFVRFRTNALGCRDSDYPTDRPPTTARILLLGDGFTEGDGVYEEDTFARRLGRQLNALPPGESRFSQYEIINCGVSRYGTHEQRLFAESLAVAYRPDVIVMTMGWNDDQWYSEERRRKLIEAGLGRLGQLSFLIRRIQASLHLRRIYDYRPSIEDLLAVDEAARSQGGRLGVAVSRHGPPQLGDSLLATVRQGLAQSQVPVLDLGRPAMTDSSQALAGDGPGLLAHRAAADELLPWLLKELGLPSKAEVP